MTKELDNMMVKQKVMMLRRIKSIIDEQDCEWKEEEKDRKGKEEENNDYRRNENITRIESKTGI